MAHYPSIARGQIVDLVGNAPLVEALPWKVREL
jgi:hypothetical protein